MMLATGSGRSPEQPDRNVIPDPRRNQTTQGDETSGQRVSAPEGRGENHG
jgi:hypothetical protein